MLRTTTTVDSKKATGDRRRSRSLGLRFAHTTWDLDANPARGKSSLCIVADVGTNCRGEDEANLGVT